MVVRNNGSLEDGIVRSIDGSRGAFYICMRTITIGVPDETRISRLQGDTS